MGTSSKSPVSVEQLFKLHAILKEAGVDSERLQHYLLENGSFAELVKMAAGRMDIGRSALREFLNPEMPKIEVDVDVDAVKWEDLVVGTGCVPIGLDGKDMSLAKLKKQIFRKEEGCRQKGKYQPELVCLEESVRLDGVSRFLASKKLQFAGWEVMMFFLAKYKSWQGRFPIVSLSDARFMGPNYVIANIQELDSGNSRAVIHITEPIFGLGSGCRILAIPK